MGQNMKKAEFGLAGQPSPYPETELLFGIRNTKQEPSINSSLSCKLASSKRLLPWPCHPELHPTPWNRIVVFSNSKCLPESLGGGQSGRVKVYSWMYWTDFFLLSFLSKKVFTDNSLCWLQVSSGWGYGTVVFCRPTWRKSRCYLSTELLLLKHKSLYWQIFS